MRITISWDCYNQRRYNRPWIARVTAWPVGSRPAIEWGNYLGNDKGGELEIEAAVGDVIRYGQKDGRGKSTINRYAIVLEDGSLLVVGEPNAKGYYVSEDKSLALGDLLLQRNQLRAARDANKSSLDIWRAGGCKDMALYNRAESDMREARKLYAI